jgi:hypothetical protein
MPLKKGGFQNPVRFAPTSVASVTGNRLQDGQGGALFLWLSVFAGVIACFFFESLFSSFLWLKKACVCPFNLPLLM